MVVARTVSRLSRCNEPHSRSEFDRARDSHRDGAARLAGSARRRRLFHSPVRSDRRRHRLGLRALRCIAASGGRVPRHHAGDRRGHSLCALAIGSNGDEIRRSGRARAGRTGCASDWCARARRAAGCRRCKSPARECYSVAPSNGRPRRGRRRLGVVFGNGGGGGQPWSGGLLALGPVSGSSRGLAPCSSAADTC
jgi:hypothetical protein